MDFDIGYKNEHRFICMECIKPIYVSEIDKTPFINKSVKHLEYYWMSRLKKFFNIYKPIKWFLSISFPLLLILLIGFSINFNTRKYVNTLITLFVLFLLLINRIPLDIFPYSNINAITNGGNKYKGAGRLSFMVVIITILTTFSIELIRTYFQDGYTCFTKLNERSDRVTKQISSTLLIVIPIVYITYITVTDTYTMAGSPLNPYHIRKNGKTTLREVEDFMKGLENTNLESKRMKEIWFNRKKIMKNTYN